MFCFLPDIINSMGVNVSVLFCSTYVLIPLNCLFSIPATHNRQIFMFLMKFLPLHILIELYQCTQQLLVIYIIANNAWSEPAD